MSTPDVHPRWNRVRVEEHLAELARHAEKHRDRAAYLRGLADAEESQAALHERMAERFAAKVAAPPKPWGSADA